MNLRVEQGNICEIDADAIVNAANPQLILGSGVAGAIREAGGPTIQAACDLFPYVLQEGAAIVTTAGELPHRCCIHAASVPGPGEPTTLGIVARATRSAVAAAEGLRCVSMVMPAFGTGVGGLTVPDVARVMVNECRSYPTREVEVVTFVAYNGADQMAFARALGA